MKDLVKLYYRIGEVSQIVGVQPHVLRYWESEFRTIRPQKSSKGQRVYSRKDVEKLLRVKDLLRNQGFTIAGARRRLAQGSRVRTVEGRVTDASTEAKPNAHAVRVSVAPKELHYRSPVSAVPPPRDTVHAAAARDEPAERSGGGHDAAPPDVSETARPQSPMDPSSSVVMGAGQCCGGAESYPPPEVRQPASRALGESRRDDRKARSMRRALLSVRTELTELLGQLRAG